MTNNIIPIFFATDDNYIPFMAVALNSIKKKASRDYNYHIHILHQGLSEQNINNLKEYEDNNFTIFFDDVKESLKKFEIRHFNLFEILLLSHINND